MGIPGRGATDHKEALREVLAATSAPLAFDDFPQEGAPSKKYQAVPASEWERSHQEGRLTSNRTRRKEDTNELHLGR
jgi:hypothetical protein